MKVTPTLIHLQDISIKIIGIIIIGKNDKNYHPGKHWAFLDLFQSHVKNVLIKNMVHTCAFQENHKNFLYFWEKCKK